MFIKDIVEFHEKFDFKPAGSPTIGAPALRALRLNFLLEELVETAKAAGFTLTAVDNGGKPEVKFVHDQEVKVNLHDFLDGLVDLVYVTLGTAYLHGLFHDHMNSQLPTIFEDAWRRVQEANMQKVRATVETKRGTTFDVVKPEGWKAPDFSNLLPRGSRGPCNWGYCLRCGTDLGIPGGFMGTEFCGVCASDGDATKAELKGEAW